MNTNDEHSTTITFRSVRRRYPAWTGHSPRCDIDFLAGMIVFFLAACSHEKAAETAVPVKAATVHKTEIPTRREADAVLFPLQQAALVPKISAPVKTFYVNRGAKVRKGQLLAVLETGTWRPPRKEQGNL